MSELFLSGPLPNNTTFRVSVLINNPDGTSQQVDLPAGEECLCIVVLPDEKGESIHTRSFIRFIGEDTMPDVVAPLIGSLGDYLTEHVPLKRQKSFFRRLRAAFAEALKNELPDSPLRLTNSKVLASGPAATAPELGGPDH